jgi:nucleotide-binding universal stress UspA family protein
MYKKILVPMDGSSLAECVIGHVKAIGIGCNVPEVVILRVVEPLSSTNLAALGQMSANSAEQIEGWKRSEAVDYVAGVVQDLIKEGVSARGEVLTGRPEDQILDYSSSNRFDLIIMSTHGRSGIARWAIGSVSDRVVRISTIPVLTVAPTGCRTRQT